MKIKIISSSEYEGKRIELIKRAHRITVLQSKYNKMVAGKLAWILRELRKIESKL